MKKKLISVSFLVAFVVLATGCGHGEGYIKVVSGDMPQMGNWDGVYFSEAYGRMELSQNGDVVVGLYEGERYRGKIEGKPDGDVLHFKWTQWNEDLNGKTRETNGHGYFRYVIVEEGTAQKSRPTHYVKGEWGYLAANSGHKWEAIRFPEGTKKTLTMQETSAEKQVNSNPLDSTSGSSSVGSSSSSDSGDGAAPNEDAGGLF